MTLEIPGIFLTQNYRQYIMARWIFPVAAAPIAHGYVAVDRGRIAAIGHVTDLPESIQSHYQPNQNTFITPGLVNTHTHLELTYPGPVAVPPGGDAVDWLLTVVDLQKKSAQENPAGLETQKDRCQKGILELLKTGTTCVNDISSDGSSLPLLHRAGLRGSVALEFFHPAKAHEGLSRLQDIIEKFNILQENYGTLLSRVSLGLSPHSLYNVSASAWKLVVQSCTPAVVHSHVAELAAEIAYLKGEESRIEFLHQTVLKKKFVPERLALSPIEILLKAGLLPSSSTATLESLLDSSRNSSENWHAPLIMAHVIYTTARERQLLSHKQVGIAHCPRSNLFLHGKTLHWPDWQNCWEEGGVFIGLGTDSTLSTPNLDLREEARVAMQQHGWTAQQALRHCTWEGACVMGLGNETGSLEIGKDADMVLWQLPGASSSHLNEKTADSTPEDRVFDPKARVIALWILGQRI